MAHDFLGDVSPLTTIPLPSDESWYAATRGYHDLKLIVEAIRSAGEVSKKDLLEKLHFSQCQLKAFEVTDGIEMV